MTAVALADQPGGPGDDGDILDRVPCRCGRLAVIVLTHECFAVTCVVRCECGAFAPADDPGERR